MQFRKCHKCGELTDGVFIDKENKKLGLCLKCYGKSIRTNDPNLKPKVKRAKEKEIWIHPTVDLYIKIAIGGIVAIILIRMGLGYLF